jgi:N-acetylneuraminic acid mutarotase
MKLSLIHPLITAAFFTAIACAGDENLPSGPEAEQPNLQNFSSNTWSTRARMPTSRAGLVAVKVNGRIYAIGGRKADYSPVATVEVYDPKSVLSPWSPRAPMPAPRAFPSGATAIDGKIYVSGGYNAQNVLSSSLFVYNVADNKWTVKANMPVANATGASVAINGKLYVLTGPTSSNALQSRLYRYDPATDTWTERTPPGANLQASVVGVINGKLYVAGGVGHSAIPLATLYVYNPVSNSWSSKASMPTPRKWAMGGSLGGKLYVVGGVDTTGGLSPGSRANEAYDPATNIWSRKTQMPFTRWMGASSVVEGILYVIGGETPTSHAVSSNEAFAP